MTHDLGIGRWRRSRTTTVPVEEDTAVELALTKMLDNAENRLLAVQAKTEAILLRLADRRRWCGATAEAVLSELKHEVFEVHLIVTGKAK